MIVITVARKPLAEGGVASNVLKHGVGALNIGASRIGYSSPEDMTPTVGKGEPGALNPGCGADFPHHKENWGTWTVNTSGRWPANVILEHLPGCDSTACAPGCPVAALDAMAGNTGAAAPVRGTEASKPVTAEAGIYNVRERVPGVFHGDKGGASRFFKQVRREH